MKKQILSFLFVLGLGLFMTNTAFADNEVKVAAGSTVVYTVKNGNGTWTGATPRYDWKIFVGPGYTTEATTEVSATLGITSSNSIKWNTAGSYKIQIIATDALGCKSEPFETIITVSNLELCIAPDNTQVGTVTPAAPLGLETCSLIGSGTSGNSGSGMEQTEFWATLKGGVANHTYQVKFKVGNTDGIALSNNLVTDTDGNGAVKITINTTDYATEFTNDNAGTSPTSDKTVIISVVSVTDGSYTSIPGNLCNTNPNYSVKVRTTPTLSFQ